MIKKILLSSLVVAIAMADNVNDIVSKILPSTEFKKAFQTGIPDLIGVQLNSGTIMYIHQPTELIFVGEIMTKTGVSLTQIHRENSGDYKAVEAIGIDSVSDVTDLLEYSISANSNSKKDLSFLIFTDPDCPYCQEADKFLKANNADIRHFFIPLQLHPKARDKSIKIIALTNKISEVESTKLLDDGLEKVKELNIDGTPQIIVYDKKTNNTVAIIKGFNKVALEKYNK
ncbi:hypothetical protein A9K75_06660 [Campylobacter fetus subsp. testudinum]|uniref:thioredoxin family protein n=1 Tax=Campylobacter fetus TaxID=196 RepID=UPI00081890A6|nr:thioredoxin family protein [Campylobacter fetus]OCR99546.1 hypothetical protein A9K75_06660 [Campylobacter fetus subsp. testudinum]